MANPIPIRLWKINTEDGIELALAPRCFYDQISLYLRSSEVVGQALEEAGLTLDNFYYRVTLTFEAILNPDGTLPKFDYAVLMLRSWSLHLRLAIEGVFYEGTIDDIRPAYSSLIAEYELPLQLQAKWAGEPGSN